MTGYRFSFHGVDFQARPSGALWWPATHSLILADLHLEKSSRMARRGGTLLPPFETADTLARLRAEQAATGARRILLLGDTFDGDVSAGDPSDGDDLFGGLSGVEVLAITGNHDPRHGLSEHRQSGLIFRHIARNEAGAPPDLSGHYHPKIRLRGRGYRCFLIGERHVILPAFGTYTGGLWHNDPVLAALIPRGVAVMTGAQALAFPFAL